MPKDRDQEKRYVFVKDERLSRTDFDSYEAATEAAGGIEDSDEQRVRVRMRSRTGKWDVVVKRRQPVPVNVNPPATGVIVAKGP